MTLGSDNSRILSGQLFSTWVLGNFKTVDEVKKVLSSGDVQIWLPDVKLFDSLPVPLHYAIHDKIGGAIVIEFTDGLANIYDNPVNVLTNGPHFPWHLENLNNYTFDNVDKNTGQLGKQTLATADSGIALTSLPAANTSQGRFVKAAFYANYVRKGKTPAQAINQLGHIMNNFDRPDGFTIDPAGSVGDGPSSNEASSEVSVFTVMKDLSHGKYYMRSINNSLNWAVVDLAALKDLKEVKAISAYEINDAGAQNASSSFLQ
jgi:penicillin V acylase-like amidase (Ntn superfamily)